MDFLWGQEAVNVDIRKVLLVIVCLRSLEKSEVRCSSRNRHQLGFTQVTCRLQSEREVVAVDANGKEVRRADGEKIKAENITIGVCIYLCVFIVLH